MNTKETAESRELTLAELDEVAGGDTKKEQVRSLQRSLALYKVAT